jgi:hypothetical protein
MQNECVVELCVIAYDRSLSPNNGRWGHAGGGHLYENNQLHSITLPLFVGINKRFLSEINEHEVHSDV